MQILDVSLILLAELNLILELFVSPIQFMVLLLYILDSELSLLDLHLILRLESCFHITYGVINFQLDLLPLLRVVVLMRLDQSLQAI